MLGGHLSLAHRFAPDRTRYATMARGYKAGGFNIGPDVPIEQRKFSAEYLWNFEIGERRSWFNARLSTDSTLFYMRRSHQQVSASTQLNPNDPSTFVFIISNAARGENYGLESTASYRLNDRWQVFGSLGLLHTRYLGYSYVDPSSGVKLILDGRQQAHAPDYRFSLGADWHDAAGGWRVSIWPARQVSTTM